MIKNQKLAQFIASGALASLAFTAATSSAQAAALIPGSELAITGSSFITSLAAGGITQFFNFETATLAPVGRYGDFDVSPFSSTGSFAVPTGVASGPAIADGPAGTPATFLAPYPGPGPNNYDILSISPTLDVSRFYNEPNGTTSFPEAIGRCAAAVAGGVTSVRENCIPFLAIRTTDGTLWRFALTSFDPLQSGDSVTATGNGVWFDGEPQLAFGSFSGEIGTDTFSANFVVNGVVPEPSTVLGLLAVGLVGGAFRSRKQK